MASDGIGEIVASFFGSHAEGLVIEPITTGHINDTHKISLITPKGDKAYFIIQRINREIFKYPNRIMNNIELVARHLQSKGYARTILKPLRTIKGSLLSVRGRGNAKEYWRAYPFIAGGYTVNTVETVGQAEEAGFAFGEYIRYLGDIDMKQVQVIIPNFHNISFRVGQYEAAKATSKGSERWVACAREMAFLDAQIPSFAKSERMPVRITHNDTKINNILFDRITGKASCILDLDTLMPGSLLSDFGDMVRTYTPAFDENEADVGLVEMRMPYFEAMTRGFLGGLGSEITQMERENLVRGAERVVLVQMMRFLTDYLNGDTYYKTEYGEQNLVRTRNQMKLLESIFAQEEDMLKIFRISGAF